MAKKALVAGGAGFIGSHLCEHLLAKGYEVTALDSLVTGQMQNAEELQSQGVKWIEQDIIKSFTLPETYDEIYNLASPASPIDFAKIPIYILETAAIGHRNLLNIAVEQKAKILYASTSEVYGDPLEHPQREDYWGNVNPNGVRSCYDEAKRYGEALTMACVREKGADVRIARIFNTYGPRMRADDGRIVPNFINQLFENKPVTIYGEGQQTRSFCYVQDLVEGLYLLMQSPETRPVNLGADREMTILEFVKVLESVMGADAKLEYLPMPENDPKKRKPDSTRARESLGWCPKVSLEEGLGQTVEYFRK